MYVCFILLNLRYSNSHTSAEGKEAEEDIGRYLNDLMTAHNPPQKMAHLMGMSGAFI